MEEQKEIEKAASFPIALDTKDGPPTMEAIRKLVESPEFQAAKEKASKAGRDATAAVTRRIEEVLTDEQREAYHKLLGAAVRPVQAARQDGRESTNARSMSGLQRQCGVGGGGGGQRADPDFKTKVARPAYAGPARASARPVRRGPP